MDQHGHRSCRIQHESKLSSDICCVLSNRNRAEIEEMLRDTTHDLESIMFENDGTVYHLIMENDKLTEEDIIAISEIFRARGVYPNIRNIQKYEPVHYAIQKRMKNVTDFFIRCKSQESREEPYDTLTKFFVEDENKRFWNHVKQNDLWDSEKIESDGVNFLEWLISREPNFYHRNYKGIGSIEVAIECDLQHLLPVLLSRTTDPPIQQATYLDEFLNNFDRKSHRMRFLGHDKNRERWYSYYKWRYATKIVKILLNKGAAVRDPWVKYVQWAIKRGEDIDIIKLLLDHFPRDCDESDVATTFLDDLMRYPTAYFVDSEIDCYRQILRDLLAKGVDLDSKTKAVQTAVDKKNLHAVVCLNEIGVNFHVLGSKAWNLEWNLLHLLATNHFTTDKDNAQEAIFDLLIGIGCEVNAKDAKGLTPLHMAVENGNKTMARKLIEQGAAVNCKDKASRTPLHYVGITMHLQIELFEMVEMLLENGANVNAKDSCGKNFFFQAVASVKVCARDCRADAVNKVLKLLVKWGAQVNSLFKFDEGKVMDLAREIDVDTFREFLKWGLDVNNSRFCNFVYERSSDIKTLMEKHCVELKAAGLHCSEDYSSRSDDQQACQRHYKECLKEIETLKATFIDSHTSLYDFLRMTRVRKCIHVNNNEKLKTVVDSPNLETQFPLYATRIAVNYREAVARKSLMEPAKDAWLELTEISLLDDCLERVLSYLSNDELEDMIDMSHK